MYCTSSFELKSHTDVIHTASIWRCYTRPLHVKHWGAHKQRSKIRICEAPRNFSSSCGTYLLARIASSNKNTCVLHLIYTYMLQFPMHSFPRLIDGVTCVLLLQANKIQSLRFYYEHKSLSNGSVYWFHANQRNVSHRGTNRRCPPA